MECMCAQTRPRIILSSETVFGNFQTSGQIYQSFFVLGGFCLFVLFFGQCLLPNCCIVLLV